MFNIKMYSRFLLMQLKDGFVLIEMFPEKAPKHVEQIIKMVKEGFYNGLTFHRVIDGFVAQGGCPKGNGTGGYTNNLPAEFNDIKHIRGIMSMARGKSEDSASSQFFICLADAPNLDGKYTVWGKVKEGMEIVDKIKKGTGPNGKVTEPDKIISMTILEDLPLKVGA
jgi:peptidylprolyl isomerase